MKKSVNIVHSHLCFIQVSEKWNYFEPPWVMSTTYKAQIYINTNLLFFITLILKSLVVPIIWLALTDVIYSQIALFLALNHIFFPANEEATLKTNNKSYFKACLTDQIADQIAEKMKDKEYHVANFATFVSKTLSFSPQKMDELNFRPVQYCINKIIELTKSCI